MLDGGGFPRKSKLFAVKATAPAPAPAPYRRPVGNVSEDDTLETMLGGLGASKDTMVIMDAGIATEGNVQWLSDNGYRYLVVSRKRSRDFDPDEAISDQRKADTWTACQGTAHHQRSIWRHL